MNSLLAILFAAHVSLPPASTPGAINPAVTQDNIAQTICVRGWTRTVRPPESYTERIKRRLVPRGHLQDYELDHIVPLDLGGAPRDPRNLWAEPRWPADGWTAERKDELEAVLVRKVCAGELPLNQARSAIATNWIEAYRKYVGNP